MNPQQLPGLPVTHERNHHKGHRLEMQNKKEKLHSNSFHKLPQHNINESKQMIYTGLLTMNNRDLL